MARPTTRSVEAPGVHVLVYDGGCPFCTATATWLQRHARQRVDLLRFEEVDTARLLAGLSREEVEATAHLIMPDGVEYYGGAAVTQAMRLVRFGGAAAVLDLPGLTYVRDAGYTLVARSRPWLSRWIHPRGG